MKKTIQIPIKINLFEVQRFLNSFEFSNIYKKTFEREYKGTFEKPYKNIEYKIFQTQISSVDYNPKEEMLNFNITVIIRKTNTENNNRPNEIIHFIEYGKIIFNKKQDDIHKPSDIYLKIQYQKQYGSPSFFDRTPLFDLSFFLELKDLVEFESYSFEFIKPTTKLFRGLSLKSVEKFLGTTLKDLINAHADTTFKPVEYSINYFIVECLEYKVLENKLVISGISKSMVIGGRNKELLINYGINIKYNYSMIKCFLSSISFEKFYSSTFNIEKVNNIIRNSDYIMPISFLSINEVKEIDEIENYKRRIIDEQEIKKFHEEIRNEDPYGTGGDEPSSSIFDL